MNNGKRFEDVLIKESLRDASQETSPLQVRGCTRGNQGRIPNSSTSEFGVRLCAAALNPLVKVTRIKVTYPRFFSAFWPAGAVELNRGRMYEFECENSKSRWHRSRGYVR